jgi:hypothetical protein
MAKNDPRDPTWQYIVQALSRSRAFSHTQGHTLRGECCCFVSGLALGLVMQTRNGAKAWSLGDGGPTLTTDDRKGIELAYADHYLNMRASTGLLGAPGVVANFAASTGYDTYKKAILAMKALGNEPFPALAPNPLDPASMIPDATKPLKLVRAVFCGLVAGTGEMLARNLQENPNVPLSAPTPEGAYWANQGNIDGFDDARLNPSGEELLALRKYSSWRSQKQVSD